MRDTLSANEVLKKLQQDTFGYFLYETDPSNGLVPDNTHGNAPASILGILIRMENRRFAVSQGHIHGIKGLQISSGCGGRKAAFSP